MTFLELCQMVARESTVISGALPSSVVSQTGKLGKLVNWTAEAWIEIQMLRPDWFWMQGEFTSPATASGGTGRYSAASFGITTRFGDWTRDKRLQNGDVYRPMTLYAVADGVAGEGALVEISWERWRTKYGRGTQTENKPSEWAVSPAGEFCLGPIPDGAYIIKGPYQKSVQDLRVQVGSTSINLNTPECPESFHPIVAWAGLKKLIRHDEAPAGVWDGADAYFKGFLAGLERHELEDMTLAGDPVA
jgi:hypothetical protein